MISPDEIRQKAANLYPAFVQAWLGGQSFFPCVIRGNKSLTVGDPSGSISAVQMLRDHSKAVTGVGYTVEWVERASRGHGRNAFPRRITVESEEDFLTLIGRQGDFRRFTQAVEVIRSSLPELNSWIASHVTKLTEIADSVKGLVTVTKYLQAHPRPGVFPRELPVAVPTKFIEWHQAVLREWMDLALPPASIDASETQFARRYGLRHVQPHLFVRVLDHELMAKLRWPFDELSLPIDRLEGLNFSGVKVFIVENRVNALTLPKTASSIVLGGLGDGVIILRRLPWLSNCEVIYWGDLDAEGFEALSSLRSFVPNAETMLMDSETLQSWHNLVSKGTGHRIAKPLFLTSDEAVAYRECCEGNLRIEQERIPQTAVIEALEHRGIFML